MGDRPGKGFKDLETNIVTALPRTPGGIVSTHGGHKKGRDALLSIVIALHNEEQAIGALFSELLQIEAHLDCRVEYVCVNDGSTDGTLALLRESMLNFTQSHDCRSGTEFWKRSGDDSRPCAGAGRRNTSHRRGSAGSSFAHPRIHRQVARGLRCRLRGAGFARLRHNPEANDSGHVL
jgi:glycosyltransferase involved in cell wall biosynthesis